MDGRGGTNTDANGGPAPRMEERRSTLSQKCSDPESLTDPVNQTQSASPSNHVQRERAACPATPQQTTRVHVSELSKHQVGSSGGWHQAPRHAGWIGVSWACWQGVTRFGVHTQIMGYVLQVHCMSSPLCCHCWLARLMTTTRFSTAKHLDMRMTGKSPVN